MIKKLCVIILSGLMILAAGCGNTGSSDSSTSTAKSSSTIALEYVTPDELAADGALTTESGDAPSSDNSQSDDNKQSDEAQSSDSSDGSNASSDSTEQPPAKPDGDSNSDSNASSDNNASGGQPPEPPSGDGNAPSGQPPAKPDGDSNSDSSEQPPEPPSGDGNAPSGQPPAKPDGDSNSDSNGQPPEPPSGSEGGPGGANGQGGPGGGANTQNYDFSGSYKGVLTADGGNESTTDDSSKANNESKEKDESTADDESTAKDASTADDANDESADSAESSDSKEVTSENETITATESDQNALLANNGGTLNVSGATISKSGDDTDGDRCNFYGLNSSVLAVGEDSKVYLSDSKIESGSAGSNALFATDSGTIYANSVDITTTKGDNSRGLDATYKGVIYGSDLNVSTEKAHCAALATDRGGGFISVTDSKLATAGSGSPLIYSTGDIEVDNVTGTASGSQIAGMEGYNRIIIYNSELESTNDATSGSDPIKNGVILYQSMSGDADTSSSAVADFEAVNSKLTTAITDGAMFYVTNTKAKVVLKDTEIQTGSDKVALIQATGNDSNNWGSAGKNGGTLTFTGYGETLSGDIIADTISNVDFYLMEGSTWTGATDIQENSSSKSAASDDTLKISVDGTSTWVVTGDCTVSGLSVADGGKVVDSSGKTVTIKSADKTIIEGDSDITVTVTGTYSDQVETTELTQPATKVLDRSEFDSHFGNDTKFGA